jgi:Ca2+-binding RTX toxin-like protein
VYDTEIAFTATSTGTYYLKAGTIYGNSGSYTIAAASYVDDYAASADTAGAVTIDGSAVSGQIEVARDTDYFKVELTAGTSYRFNLDSSDLYSDLTLLDANLHYLRGSGYGTMNSEVIFTATSSGTYYLVAAQDSDNSDTGAYSLAATTITDDFSSSTNTTGVVTVEGGPVSGQIEVAGDTDLFKVELTAGSLYRFNLDSTAFDSYLTLRDESLNYLAGNDDSHGTLNSEIVFAANASGTYYLEARPLNYAAAGAYTIAAAAIIDDFSSSTDTTGVVTIGGSPVSGQLETVGDSDLFRVDLIAGNSYRFNLNSQVLDGRLTLLDANLNVLASNDNANGTLNSEIIFTATSSGTFYIDAHSYGNYNSMGDYTVSAASFVNVISGNASANALTGTAGADVLNGLGGNDTLSAGNGNDTLNGGVGADTLNGGSGNDVLVGGAGQDKLTGGSGADIFVFNNRPGADTVMDFQSGVDRLQLDSAVFTALGAPTSALDPSQFWASATANAGHDADDRIIYNTRTGRLYYDADGNGSGAAVVIALLGTRTHPTLDAADFYVI